MDEAIRSVVDYGIVGALLVAVTGVLLWLLREHLRLLNGRIAKLDSQAEALTANLADNTAVLRKLVEGREEDRRRGPS